MAKKRSARKRTTKTKAPLASPSPRGLAKLSVAELQLEIRRRQRSTKTLLRRRAALLAKIEALDAAIAERGGALESASAGAGGKRPKNETSLLEALRAVLKGKTMSVIDATAAVQKAGYKSRSANFRTVVNMTLFKHRDQFKKVARGQYTAA